MVMERMEKATIAKIAPKATTAEVSRLVEIEEAKLLFRIRVTAPSPALPEYYELTVTPLMPVETEAFGSMLPTGPIPPSSRGYVG